MKNFYNITSILFVLLYIAGVLLGVYYLTADAAKVQKVSTAFPELIYLQIGLSMLGLLGFLFLFLRKEANMEIVYATSQTHHQTDQSTNEFTDKDIEGSEQSALARHLFFKAKQDSGNSSTPFLEFILRAICQHLEVGIGAMYVRQGDALSLHATYALYRAEGELIQYQLGEGLVGQVAKDGKPIKLTQVPEGYMEVVSGLGSAYPHFLILYPVKDMNKDVNAVIELATFKTFGAQELGFLEEMALLLAREVESVVIK
jgi:hypothetical protein